MSSWVVRASATLRSVKQAALKCFDERAETRAVRLFRSRTTTAISLVLLSVLATIVTPASIAGAAAPTTFQAVYAVPSDATPVAGRGAGISENLIEMQDWYVTQTGGGYPVFNRSGASIDVPTVVLSKTSAQIHGMQGSALDSLLRSEAESAVPSGGNK